MNTLPVIELRSVSKSFSVWEDRPDSIKKALVQILRGSFQRGVRRKKTVLKDITFAIRPGEFVGIMGRNGAGKSTIMKMIAGIYTPNSGELRVGGKVAPLLELGAGFSPELTGLDNIYLNAAILGFSRDSIENKIETIIEFSELEGSLSMPVKKYSSGMMVRLGFAIAAHLDAPILLFDEILAVGDSGFQQKCLKKISELHKAGRSIILITHDPKQVEHYCDRCIVIESAGVAFDGPAKGGAATYSKLFATPATASG